MIDIDRGSELAYNSSSASGENIDLIKGKIWIESKSPTLSVSLKNLTVVTPPSAIVIASQDSRGNSSVYGVSGTSTIRTRIGSYTLNAGNRIMLSPTDLSSSQSDLADFAGPIDDSMNTESLFTRNNGSTILTNLAKSVASLETKSGSMSTLSSSGANLIAKPTKMVEIMDPID
jgi:hypothetical protein